MEQTKNPIFSQAPTPAHQDMIQQQGNSTQAATIQMLTVLHTVYSDQWVEAGFGPPAGGMNASGLVQGVIAGLADFLFDCGLDEAKMTSALHQTIDLVVPQVAMAQSAAGRQEGNA